MKRIVQEFGTRSQHVQDEMDVVRIDLYASENDVVFSEFTFTTFGCMPDFTPRVADGLLYAISHNQIPNPTVVVTSSYVQKIVTDTSWVLVSLEEEEGGGGNSDGDSDISSSSVAAAGAGLAAAVDGDPND